MNHYVDAATFDDLLSAGRTGELVESDDGVGVDSRVWHDAYDLLGLAFLSVWLKFDGAGVRSADAPGFSGGHCEPRGIGVTGHAVECAAIDAPL